jgi:hypothetical protein
MAVHPLATHSSAPVARRGRPPHEETALQMLEGEAYGGCADCRAYDQRRLMRIYHDAQHDRLLGLAKRRAVEIGAVDIAQMIGLAEQHDAAEDGEAEAGDGHVACAHRRFRSIASAVEYAETAGGPGVR